jgi:pimeloyl-ACP methyl ester carboxylesterase
VTERAVAVTVRDMHRAVSDGAFRWLGPLGRPVRHLHDTVVEQVYGALQFGLRGVGELLTAGPGRRDATDSSGAAIRARAIAHGVMDERLVARAPGFDLGVTLRHGGREITPTAGGLEAAYPDARGRIVVFVHGLVDSEAVWTAGPGAQGGGLPQVALGSGATPVFVRYGTGHAIGRNGADLAELLEAAVRSWPVPVTRMVVVGHSMGGLVTRSACAVARRRGHAWTGPLTDVVYLATPHLGSWLEKAANVGTWALRHSSPYSAPIGSFLDLRSRGIKDLRFGTLADEGWASSPMDGLLTGLAPDDPWLAEVTHHLVAGRLRSAQRDPLNAVFGDGFVRSGSAVGRGRNRSIGGAEVLSVPVHAGHSRVVHHPEVLDLLRRLLEQR